jgi:hypothetical protein
MVGRRSVLAKASERLLREAQAEESVTVERRRQASGPGP